MALGVGWGGVGRGGRIFLWRALVLSFVSSSKVLWLIQHTHFNLILGGGGGGKDSIQGN